MSDKATQKAQKIADWGAQLDAQHEFTFGEKALQIANSLGKEFGTPNMRKVLACHYLDPTEKESIVFKCKEIGISRPTWYLAVSKPKFGELSVALAIRLKGRYAIPITMQFIKNCIHGDKDNQYGDKVAQGRYLADMGIVKDTSGHDTTVNINLTIEQLQEKIKESRMRGLQQFGLIPAQKTSDN